MFGVKTFERLHSLQEAAEVWGISIYGVRRLVKSNAVRSVTVGARILVPADEVARVCRDGVGTPRARKQRSA